MSSHFFALISRMRYISRWGLMRNTRTENVQEHSHMVAVLAHALAVIGKEKFSGSVDPAEAALAALYHDATEIFTGDMPTPVKYKNRQILGAYKEVEASFSNALLDMLPEDLKGDYRPILFPGSEIEATVKAADTLSAYIKCVEEVSAGNGEFRIAMKQTRKKLEDMRLPQLQYFMDNFMPSFELTLDELR
ncbi:MAG: 5'-deoxynucleotidase [Oscillospiraceae bacterium]|nr:5'-deoxynucleotidase [Oscillospiraceae bacterium]